MLHLGGSPTISIDPLMNTRPICNPQTPHKSDHAFWTSCRTTVAAQRDCYAQAMERTTLSPSIGDCGDYEVAKHRK